MKNERRPNPGGVVCYRSAIVGSAALGAPRRLEGKPPYKQGTVERRAGAPPLPLRNGASTDNRKQLNTSTSRLLNSVRYHGIM